MGEKESTLSWMKNSPDAIKLNLVKIFRGDYNSADNSTKALFNACYMKIIPKTTTWWKQIVEYGSEPTLSDVLTNIPPCAEAFVFLVIETYADRIGEAQKPKSTNKRKLAGETTDINEDRMVSGKEKMRQGGRPKAEPNLGDKSALTRYMNILQDVNKRRKKIEEKKRVSTNVLSVPTGANAVEDNGESDTEENDNKDIRTWYEHLSEEIISLRMEEKGSNSTSSRAGSSTMTTDGVIDAGKESEKEDTEFMGDWLKPKFITPI